MKLKVGKREITEPPHYRFELHKNVLSMANYWNPQVKALFIDGKRDMIVHREYLHEVKLQLQEFGRVTT